MKRDLAAARRALAVVRRYPWRTAAVAASCAVWLLAMLVAY